MRTKREMINEINEMSKNALHEMVKDMKFGSDYTLAELSDLTDGFLSAQSIASYITFNASSSERDYDTKTLKFNSFGNMPVCSIMVVKQKITKTYVNEENPYDKITVTRDITLYRRVK